jgi:hypothetical protein
MKSLIPIFYCRQVNRLSKANKFSLMMQNPGADIYLVKAVQTIQRGGSVNFQTFNL